jgi:ketosteroid isomerase-like protein
MRSIALALLATTLACAPASPPGATQAPVGDAAAADAARAAIVAAARGFSAAYERGDVAAMVATYTADGVILPPGRHAIRGAAALAEYWTLAPGVRVLEHRLAADSIVVAGAVAYDWGTYRVRTSDAAGAVRETFGKYVVVWRETAPGVWRMHVDMWNGAPAPAPPPSPSP